MVRRVTLIKNLLESYQVSSCRPRAPTATGGRAAAAGGAGDAEAIRRPAERKKEKIHSDEQRTDIVQTGMDTLYIINYDSKKHQSWRFEGVSTW